ncbi:MAG: hypothetical protein ACK50J_03715, partial [Planctomyces sp.]
MKPDSSATIQGSTLAFLCLGFLLTASLSAAQVLDREASPVIVQPGGPVPVQIGPDGKPIVPSSATPGNPAAPGTPGSP